MFSKYHKESILKGHVDSFCLVCESHLRSEGEVTSHIAKPIHRKNLNAAQYVESNKSDGILKIKNGHFCTFCGLILSTVTKASLHVKDEKHCRSKAVELIKRVGRYVIIDDSLLIEYEAWSGLVKDSCAVCNVDVDSQDLHRSQPTHILNLIQSKVEFGDRQQVYRKVDESIFHCITCNEIFFLRSLDSHFGEVVHKQRLDKCKEAFLAYNSKQENDKFICNSVDQEVLLVSKPISKDEQRGKLMDHSSSSEGFNSDCSSDEYFDTNSLNNDDIDHPTILDSVTYFEKNEININFENETAFCKKCFENVKFDCNSIISHIKQHDESRKRRDVSYKPFPCEVNMKCKSRSGRNHKNSELFAIAAPRTKDVGSTLKSNSVLDGNSKRNSTVDLGSTSKSDSLSDGNNRKSADDLGSTSKSDSVSNGSNRKNTDDLGSTSKRNTVLDGNKTKSTDDLGSTSKSDSVPNGNNRKNTDDLGSTSKRNTVLDGNKTKRTDDKGSTSKSNSVSDNMKRKVETDENSNLRDTNTEEDTADPVKFAKQNHLTYNSDNANAYCRICDVKLPANLPSMKEHVLGFKHKKKQKCDPGLSYRDYAAQSDKPVYKTTPMSIFIDESLKVTSLLRVYTPEIVINGKICINGFSFLMITEVGLRLRCQVCEVNLTRGEVEMHEKYLRHIMAMFSTPVVTSLDSTEFIREVRPGIFHCGYCNLIVSPWESVHNHLNSREHRSAKSYWQARLEEHMPDIMSYRVQKVRRDLAFGRLFGFNDFD